LIEMRVLVVVLCLIGCDKVFSLDTVSTRSDAERADAPERPDAPPGVCGKIGTPCCAGSAACDAGGLCLQVGSASRCVDNAGAFSTETADACGPSECDVNPYTAGCSCPTGFAAQMATIDGACGDPQNPTHKASTLTMCAADAFPTNADWGGWYIQADIAGCVPSSATGCYRANSVTTDCSCPMPTQGVPLRVYIPGVLGPDCQNGWLGAQLFMCLDPVVAEVSVRGVYERDPDGTCRQSAPMGDCNCPPASLTVSIPTFTDRLAAGKLSFMRSTITLCLAPP
jgi:hypothetical protein